MPAKQNRRSKLDWRKSRASAGNNECVEIARTGTSVLVRDSSKPSGALLEFAPAQWSAFLSRVRGGEPNNDQR
jgi:Domain of unknown function (DUF397)